MKRILVALWVAFLLAPGVSAQTPPPDDPIARMLFPPDLVMRHAGELGLDERQRLGVKEAVQKVQSRLLDVQFDMQGEAEKLARLLQARPVDETAVLAQVDKVLALERDVKKAQLSLLIRIKNLLTDAQQSRLMDLRKEAR